MYEVFQTALIHPLAGGLKMRKLEIIWDEPIRGDPNIPEVLDHTQGNLQDPSILVAQTMDAKAPVRDRISRKQPCTEYLRCLIRAGLNALAGG